MNYVLCIVWGMAVGAFIAWHFWLRQAKATLEIKIDPEVLAQINSAMGMAWLDKNGLVWMPKGVEFKAKVK